MQTYKEFYTKIGYGIKPLDLNFLLKIETIIKFVQPTSFNKPNIRF